MKQVYIFLMASLIALPMAMAQHPHKGKTLDQQINDFIRLIEAHELNLSLSYFSPEHYQEQNMATGQYLFESMGLNDKNLYGKGDGAFITELDKIKKIKATRTEQTSDKSYEVAIEVLFKGGGKKGGTLYWQKIDGVYKMFPPVG